MYRLILVSLINYETNEENELDVNLNIEVILLSDMKSKVNRLIVLVSRCKVYVYPNLDDIYQISRDPLLLCCTVFIV